MGSGARIHCTAPRDCLSRYSSDQSFGATSTASASTRSARSLRHDHRLPGAGRHEDGSCRPWRAGSASARRDRQPSLCQPLGPGRNRRVADRIPLSSALCRLLIADFDDTFIVEKRFGIAARIGRSFYRTGWEERCICCTLHRRGARAAARRINAAAISSIEGEPFDCTGSRDQSE
jgi:hypothetical protein